MSEQVKASQILRLAIELIKEKGWGKGQWVHPATGCICGAGAINMAAIQLKAPEEQHQLARQAANQTVGGMISFNDQQTSRTPVLRKLGETARRLEKEGL